MVRHFNLGDGTSRKRNLKTKLLMLLVP
jgi:hypothetical protein